jgi:hypothetical protein
LISSFLFFLKLLWISVSDHEHEVADLHIRDWIYDDDGLCSSEFVCKVTNMTHADFAWKNASERAKAQRVQTVAETIHWNSTQTGT